MKTKILKRIKEAKADLKEYHLKRTKDEYPEQTDWVKTVDDLIDYANNIEFTQDEDMVYIMAKIEAFEEVLEIIKN